MRAFIAVTFRKSSGLSTVFEMLSRNNTVRLVGENQRHVTLLFFPDINEQDSMQICSAMSSVVKPAFTSRSLGITGFPIARRANVVVLVLDSPELVSLHEALAEKSPQKFDVKPFRPHITLARSRRRPADVREYEKSGVGIDVAFERISLFRSVLTPEGPVYTEICGYQLM